MADIAQSCGILKGSLYHYFSSKEALMSAVIEYAHAYFKEKVFFNCLR
jgi:TetR/AcrR family transcriptional repressor of nem operon